MFSWNVNGIRAILRKGALQSFIDKYQPDILCIQETKANQSQVDYKPDNYFSFWNSASRPGYSGTLVFTKKPPLKVFYDFSNEIAKKFKLNTPDKYGIPNKEGRLITLEFDSFWLVNVYVPNSKGDLSRLSLRKNQWDKAFAFYLKKLSSTKPVISCGDMNVAHEEIDLFNAKIHHKDHGFTDDERAGFTNYINSGFIDIFRKMHPSEVSYTWWSALGSSRINNKGWRIDYWLISNCLTDKVIKSKIYTLETGSDHCPISIEINL